jgi:hypothetical protein
MTVAPSSPRRPLQNNDSTQHQTKLSNPFPPDSLRKDLLISGASHLTNVYMSKDMDLWSYTPWGCQQGVTARCRFFKIEDNIVIKIV